MIIEVDDVDYKFCLPDYSNKFLNIYSSYKYYINDDDKEFFYRLGIRKMAFYDGYWFNYIIGGLGYSIDENDIEDYKHPQCGLNSVFLRSLNIRFMKINKREGNVICKDPWMELI